jgi:acyl transferase domain-containing protein/NAD(P)H-dependent flavin oxidoreductase YrpB (nitropropane dioxygenase family)
MARHLEVWVNSPGNLKGIGLLTQAASAKATGVLDLYDTSPEQWGNLQFNLIKLREFYPRTCRLGFRVSSCHFESLISLSEFPDHPDIFFVLTAVSDPSELQFIKSYPQFSFCVEFHLASDLHQIETYCDRENIAISGYVAVAVEAGGRTGCRPAFLLLQDIQGITTLPIYLRGGVGVHSAATLPVAKVDGLVLDDQVLLFPSSPIGKLQKEAIGRLNGREAEIIGEEHGQTFNLIALPWAKAAQNGLIEYQRLISGELAKGDIEDFFTQLKESIFFGDAETSVWPVGQMVGMAKSYAEKYKTLQRLIGAIRESADKNIGTAFQSPQFVSGSPLALEHQTEFPVVQGPMTRVSDSPEFALEVARAGGLPFIALALLKGDEVAGLLNKTRSLLGDSSWGVGILGFVPNELREAQIKEILKVAPPFAIIAGGRPDHAQIMEDAGIKTYIHVPVPALLKDFIKQGSKRFIFEGRECGGHVGPFHSFPLWEQMVTALLEYVPVNEGENYSVLFAGGIHDSLSTAMVATLSAALSTRKIKSGILMGTAYLASKEAVETGAITSTFQDTILDSSGTTLLVSGPGHANRCVSTPFSEEFKQKRAELLRRGVAQETLTEELDGLLLGRLRMASKGVKRTAPGMYEQVSSQQLEEEGMFMAGEVTNFLSEAKTCRELHLDVTEKAFDLIRDLQRPDILEEKQKKEPVNIAIVGISVLVPGSKKTDQFWETVLQSKRHLKEIPADRWDWRLLYDQNPGAADKINSRWGGFIDDIQFDPLKYGIPPKSVPNIAVSQLLALETVTWALNDAGIDVSEADRENTSVIFATADSGGFLANSLVVRSSLPFFAADGVEETKERTPGWTEETFPGILCNVVPGRIANRLDFGGRNYAVDAACASSLVAVDLAVRELTSGRSNMVITGGIDVGQTPFGYLAFSKTGALSPTGDSIPFDKNANGIVISEGSAVLILKRVEDAERDGDKIYAVIKGVAGSSDGRAMGLTAPRSEGQQLSLSRAYDEAGFKSDTIGYYEAHGTGTSVGDNVELDTISTFLQHHGSSPHSIALGSVKSLIGHTKMAAGMVSLAKTALALYNKVLPAQVHIKEPLKKLLSENSPVFFHDKPMPWLKPAETPRRAGISAFGFGGANFHTVLEEHTGYESSLKLGGDHWPEELLAFGAASPEILSAELERLVQQLGEPLELDLKDLAWSLTEKYAGKGWAVRVAFTAPGFGQVLSRLKDIILFLKAPETNPLPAHVFYSGGKASFNKKVAFLFSGQGSQYVQMGREMSLFFPEFRDNLELTNHLLQSKYLARFSEYLFPPAPFGDGIREQQDLALRDTHVAQPAIGLVSISFLDLCTRLGIHADFVAGHSFGELTALHAAGVYNRTDFLRLAELRGLLMSTADKDAGTMAAVFASRSVVEKWIESASLDVVVANNNAPEQVVISGPVGAIEAATAALNAQNIRCMKLPVSAAFHSPMMEKARGPLNAFIESINIDKPEIPVFSNGTGMPYPETPDEIREILFNHLVEPVDFMSQIKEMHASGAGIFVELGPGQVLTGLVGKILKDQPHIALPADSGNAGIADFLSMIGRLWVEGLSVNLPELYRDRKVNSVSLSKIAISHRIPEPKLTNWIINGHGARPVNPAFGTKLPEALLTLDNESKPQQNMNNGIEKPIPANRQQVSYSEPQLSSQPRGNVDPDPVVAIYNAYQETMRQFLKTQEQVMRSFIGGDLSGFSSEAEEPTTYSSHLNDNELNPITSYATPAPVKEPTRNEVASNNRPSVRQNATVSQPVNVPVNGQSGATILSIPTFEKIQAILLAIISEKTGYPEEMIALDLDLEKELGVDSIKRMEIFAEFTSHLPVEKHIELNANVDRFVRIKNFRQLIEALFKVLQGDKEIAEVA